MWKRWDFTSPTWSSLLNYCILRIMLYPAYLSEQSSTVSTVKCAVTEPEILWPGSTILKTFCPLVVFVSQTVISRRIHVNWKYSSITLRKNVQYWTRSRITLDGSCKLGFFEALYHKNFVWVLICTQKRLPVIVNIQIMELGGALGRTNTTQLVCVFLVENENRQNQY